MTSTDDDDGYMLVQRMLIAIAVATQEPHAIATLQEALPPVVPQPRAQLNGWIEVTERA